MAPLLVTAGEMVLDVTFEASTRSCVGQLSGLTSGMSRSMGCDEAVRGESGKKVRERARE